MHLRKLTILTGFLGAFFASWAFGLGLGEIKLNSSLNQPLDADIKLLQVRGLVAEDILIELASAEDFQRAGVERPFFLQGMKFDVRLNGANGPFIKVTSELPVREPFVNFLIQARWPSGRLLREYTVLPDLPVFSERPAQPVQAPTAQAPRPAPAPTVQAQPQQPVRPAPVTRPTPAPAVSQPAPAPQPPVAQPAPQPRRAPAPTPAPEPVRTVSTGANGSQDYSVNQGDTLWEIALEVRPNRGASVQQTMLAIQRLNPDAFINGNINLLKRGQVLRIPNQGEIDVLDQVAAIDEVKFQNNQWRDGQGSSSAAELEGSSTRSASSDVDQGPRGQLSLAAPGSQTSSSGRSGAGDTSVNTEALENELAISLEELDSVRRENSELNDRIADLEEQIDTLDRLIEVSNEEMRTLELAIEMGESSATELSDSGSDQVEQAIESQSELATEVDTNLAEDTSGVAGTIAGDDTAAEVDTSEPVSAPVRAPVTTPVPVSQQPSLVDTLMGYLWYIVAGVAILILALVGLIMHRRTQAQMAEFDEFDEDDFYEDSESNDEQSTFEDLDQDDNLEDNFDIGDELEEPTEEIEAPTPTEAETGDAVGEADIYIAYGKYDQAEELLQKAIISEPDNIAARSKLLEVYSETKDIEKFDREYAQLLSFEDSSANERAAELRALIPGAAAFAANTEESANTESFDLGGDDNFGLGDTVAESAPNESVDDELGDLSFDLDDEDDAGAESSADVDNSLDFDLDLDSEDDSLLSGESEQVTADFESLDDELGDAGDGFSLDLESGLDTEVNLDSGASKDKEDDMELSLDLDLGDGDEAELNLDLDEEDLNITLGEADTAGQGETASDDILSDLEFSAAAITPDAEASSPEPTTSAPAESADLDDEFDMDMDSDVDLAALDAEMNDLVGDLDDLDDEDVPVAPIASEAATEIKEELGSLDLDSISDSINEGASESSLELEPSSDVSNEIDLDIDSTLMENDEVELGQDGGLGDDLNSELDFLADTDEVATKLDLARAYIDMGDSEGAKDILDEVNAEGNDEQKKEAAELLGKIG